MTNEKMKQSVIPTATALTLAELVDYAEDAIVSRTLVKNDAGTITLFAFDQGQSLSEHTTPFAALVQIIDGQGEFEIGGETFQLRAGQVLLMPANIPHAVRATDRFQMLLTLLRQV